MHSSSQPPKLADAHLVHYLKFALWVVFLVLPLLLLDGSLPPYWGQTSWTQKVARLDEIDWKPNRLFLGTSITYMQVDPSTIDRVIGDNLGSFNLGATDAEVVEMIGFAKWIIRQPQAAGKTLMLEVRPWDPISKRPTRQEKKYFYRPDNWRLTQSLIGQTAETNFWEKTRQSAYHNAGYLQSYFRAGLLRQSVKFHWIKDRYTNRFIGAGLDGFVPLDLATLDDYATNVGARESHEFYHSDTTVFDALRSNGLPIREEWNPVNEAYRDELLALFTYAEMNGVRLMLLIPPRLPRAAYRDLLPLAYSFPPTRVVQLADPAEFPEFYETRYSFDQIHLNAEGAGLFSDRLGSLLR
ncbi:hypothetical protein [Pontibacter sp. G13]|uniref:hypothetical protein n=1 Tax=Pontibacter sp. G13 TaxID=3074898 RepID=UPI00288935BB|nr:hypothetical protein [Pontibacter sp. G13]WNJ19780.1 hypothetical protein RJD25_04795 [Pontibacter sp. G13]